ncbi:MAG: exodeoxyribonuclease V subunit gamma [Candidatus Eisenbacteria sp.]|nr:exodeoxyribonuclease V subunit gamma [Candidatus Eisenbacteria bacterium]
MRVWIGPAGSGKTHRCLAALQACERAGERALLIVPDQFTYTADRLLLEDSELPGTRFVRILSFRRLAHLAASRWPPPGERLTEQGRRLLLRRIVQTCPEEELGPLARVRQLPGFVPALAGLFKEIKAIGGTEAATRLRAAAGEDAKLAALAALLRRYDQVLSTTGHIDPADWTLQIAERLRRDPGPWGGRRIWIDGFMSLTPEESALLTALRAISAELTLTLCADPQDARLALEEADETARHGIPPTTPEFFRRLRPRLKRPCFLPTLRTLVALSTGPGGHPTLESMTEPPRRFRASPPLARLEAGLFSTAQRGTPPPSGSSKPDEATVFSESFPTPYHEVLGWARWIDAQTRLGDGTTRYRDIVILVRDLGPYRPLIREIFDRYQIPLFIDERRDATAHPLLRLTLAALQVAALGWTRAGIIHLLRSPLLGLAPEAVDRLENLSLEYGIEYERWLETDWAVHLMPPREPAGGQADDEEQARGEEEAETRIEEEEEQEEETAGRRARLLAYHRQSAAEAREITQRIFPALESFCATWRREVPFRVGAEALRRLFTDWLTPNGKAPPTPPVPTAHPAAGAADRHPHADAAGPPPASRVGPLEPLGRLVLRFGEETDESWPQEQSEQIARLLDETLAQGAVLLEGLAVTATLFGRLLRDAFRDASIGLTPQLLDAVTAAEPRRSRVDAAPWVILGGLTAAAFPHTPEEDPLLSDAERVGLAGHNLPISTQAAVRADEDPYLFYIACTRASRGMLLTHPLIEEGGRAAEPTSYLREIERLIPTTTPDARTLHPRTALDDCRHHYELAGALTGTLRVMPPLDAGELANQAPEKVPSASAAFDQARVRAERLQVPEATELPPEIRADLFPCRTLRTSPSRLETFARCPFQHFARHLLRLEKRPEAILTPLSTGTAVHAALERFFSQAVIPGDPGEAGRQVSAIFDALSREEAFRVFQDDPPSAYRWQIARRNLGHFVRTELERLEAGGLWPAAVELAFGDEVPAEAPVPTSAITARLRQQSRARSSLGSVQLPPLELDLPAAADASETGGQVLLRGRIDRLDLGSDPSGGCIGLVIDYKHRSPGRSSRSEITRGLDLQIATYMLVLEEILGIVPIGGLYYEILPTPRLADAEIVEANPLGYRMHGVYLADTREAFDPQRAFTPARAGTEEDLQRLFTVVRRQIRLHAADILRGMIHAAPTPRGGRLPCEYCDYRTICRFDSARTTRPAAVSDTAGADPPPSDEGRR